MAAGYELVRARPQRLLGVADLPIRTVIDVGANKGQFAKAAAQFFPDATFYCFEPQPSAHARLAAWAGTTAGKVHAFQVALGDDEGTVAMTVHLDHDTSSSLLQSTKLLDETYPVTQRQARAEIPVTTLDRFMEAQAIRPVAEMLIKLDVQGYENRVIAGGPRTFDQAKACILEMNLDELYESQATFRELFLQLDARGFRYAGNLNQVYGSDGHVMYLDALFVR